jgi:hypothetical protein
MRGFVANTDYEWYRFLSGRPDLDEVNFWRPGGEQESSASTAASRSCSA